MQSDPSQQGFSLRACGLCILFEGYGVELERLERGRPIIGLGVWQDGGIGLTTERMEFSSRGITPIAELELVIRGVTGQAETIRPCHRSSVFPGSEDIFRAPAVCHGR